MRILVFALAVTTTLLLPPSALAQGPQEADVAEDTANDPAQERATQFVGVEGAEAERIPGGTLMLAAYAIVWILLFGFLFRVRMLQRQTSDDLRRLSAEIKASGGD